MSTYHRLTSLEKERLARAREANPQLPLTSEERAILRQAEAEGATQNQADVRARKVAREAAVLDHEKRPINWARITHENRLAQDRPGNRQSQTILEMLRKRAEDEDRRLDAEMVERKRAYLCATDPAVVNAIENAEGALKLASDVDRIDRAKALGVAKEGDVKAYWKFARELDAKMAERETTKTITLATEKSDAEARHAEQKRTSDKAFKRAAETLVEAKKMLADETEETVHAQ